MDENTVKAKLLSAVRKNKPHKLRAILNQYPELLTNTSIFGDQGAHEETPLHVAADEGHLELVGILIDEFGVRPDIVATSTYLSDVLPIHLAAYNDHADVVSKLAHAYPEGVNECDGYGFTPLHHAVANDAENAICALLECEAVDVSETTSICDLIGVEVGTNYVKKLSKLPPYLNALELAEYLRKPPQMIQLFERTVLARVNNFEIVKLGKRYWLVENKITHGLEDEEEFVKNLQKLTIGDIKAQQKKRRGTFVKKLQLPAGANKQEILVKLVTSLVYESARHKWASRICQVRRRAIAMLDSKYENWTLEKYKALLAEFQTKTRTYWGENLSENSDDDDDESIQKSVIPELFSTIVKLQQTPKFWQDTRRTTPQKAGLQEKLAAVIALIKEKKITDVDVMEEKVRDCLGSLKTDLLKRARLPYVSLGALTETQTSAYKKINKIIGVARSSGQFTEGQIKKITALCEKHQIYIPQFRGINYMIDRWNAPSRRYHRKMIEVGKPQHSEMVLKTLEFNFYTELNADNDYSVVVELQEKLAVQDALVRDFLINLRENGEACVDYTDRNKNTPYVFNNILERLQHSYSNGIRDFLAELEKLRKEYPGFWTMLPNAFNPFVSTGHGVYHCLKYAYGMKVYYGDSMLPRYRSTGQIEYSHLGKVYAMLYRFDEILFSERPNNVPQLDKEGRIRLLNDIGPEKEIAFLGFVQGANVVYQYTAKFPDFSGEYKPIYEVKYGLNKSLYKSFRYLICGSVPETSLRNAIIDLLNEWLCAYHEILLNRLMLQKVKEKGGILLFWGDEGMLTLEPTKRLLTGGEPNKQVRERTHFLRQQRELLGERLRDEEKSEGGEHGFDVISEMRFQKKLSEIPQKDIVARLKSTQGYILTPVQHKKFSADQKNFSAAGFKGGMFSTPQPSKKSPQLFPSKAFSEGGELRKKRTGPLFASDPFHDQMRIARMLSLIQFQEEGGEPRNLYGLEPYNIDYEEGDCLFVGVAAYDSDGRTDLQLRKTLVDRIRNTPAYVALIRATLTTFDVRDRTLRVGDRERVYNAVDDYLAYMSTAGTWGRELEVQIIASILRRPIIILTPFNMNDLIMEEATYADQPPIFLNLINYAHFQPLMIPAGQSGEEILQQIRANLHGVPTLGN